MNTRSICDDVQDLVLQEPRYLPDIARLCNIDIEQAALIVESLDGRGVIQLEVLGQGADLEHWYCHRPKKS